MTERDPKPALQAAKELIENTLLGDEEPEPNRLSSFCTDFLPKLVDTILNRFNLIQLISFIFISQFILLNQ